MSRVRVETIDHIEMFVPGRREAADRCGNALGLDLLDLLDRYARRLLPEDAVGHGEARS